MYRDITTFINFLKFNNNCYCKNIVDNFLDTFIMNDHFMLHNSKYERFKNCNFWISV